ncbi:uncharacterized protein [Halyomorpha halys]|uniref:uncharacterized protein n=1 Tax=Halyomorpha halys TaxID=286706 RepID=UPI0034D15409
MAESDLPRKILTKVLHGARRRGRPWLRWSDSRTEKQLKKYWDNLKTERKRELSARKKVLGSPGEPPSKILKEGDSTDKLFQDSFSTESEDAEDSVNLTLPEKNEDPLFVISDQGTLQPLLVDIQYKRKNEDKSDVLINHLEESLSPVIEEGTTVKSCRSNNVDKSDIIIDEFEDRLSPIEGDETALPGHINPILERTGGLRREMVARALRVEALIKHDEAIHSFLLEEAKYKALAAQEIYEEKRLFRQKAEIELQIKKFELEELIKKYQNQV